MAGTVSPLKVCHIFAGTEGGRWVCDQLEALRDEHGCDVHALLGGDDGPTVDRCREAGIPVTAFDFRLFSWRSLATLPWRIVKLAWWLRRQQFDVVQSHVIQSTMFARPAAWLADIPVRLVMVTGPFYMQAPASRQAETSTAWMETGIIPSCALAADLYREAGIGVPILPTLYYGPRAENWDPATVRPADLRAELGLAEETPLIGCVAVFYPRCAENDFVPAETRNRHVKGHEELIHAMPLVLRDFPNAKLLLIGKGWGPKGEQTEAELRDMVRLAGLEDSIIFTGYRTDIAAVYRGLDVSVQASLNDNLGGTVESLLMARPTVATRVGGLVDAVKDGETGVLVAPGDPQDLARGILKLLRDPAEGARLGAAGRAWMLDRFTLATTAAGLAGLYRRQRAAAQGAWRARVTLGRLAMGAVCYPPVFVRTILWNMYLRFVVKNLGDRVAARMKWRDLTRDVCPVPGNQA